MGHLKTRFEYGDDVSAIAHAAITGARLVTLVAGGRGTQGKPRVAHTGAATDYVYGVAAMDRAAEQDVTVTRRSTVMLLEAGGAIAENGRIMPGAAGRVVADDATTAGRNIVGRALHAAAGAGSMVWCIVDFRVI